MANNASVIISNIGLSAFAALVVAYPITSLDEVLFSETITRGNILFIAILTFVILAVIPFILNRQRIFKGHTQQPLDTIHQIVLFGIAINLFKWSLLKFFHLFLTTSLIFLDMPLSDISGYDQMSHFFGQNQFLKISIGVMELTAAVLVLLKPTRILGAGLSIVIQCDIILIYFVYGIYGPIPEAVLLLMASLYIVWLDRALLFNLRNFQTGTQADSRYVRIKVPHIVKALALFIPLILLAPQYQKQVREGITGKYRVLNSLSNIPLFKELKDDRQIRNMYFDFGDHLVFTSTDLKNKYVGKLEFMPASNTFVCHWVDEHSNLTDFSGEFIKSGLDYPSVLLIKYGGKEYEIGLRRVYIKGLRKIY